MSSTFDEFKGDIILNATLEAKPGRADEIAQLLQAIKENANSDNEPGCATYRIARSGLHFAVWEKYTGKEAIKQHFASKQFQALGAVAADALVKPPSILYFEEF